MDDPDIDAAELAGALRWLAALNRRLGGIRAILRLFKQWSATWERGETIQVLDIGTGSADYPIALHDWASKAGFDLRITAVDLHPKTLAFAKERIGPRLNIDLVLASALDLMDSFAPRSFDYVHAGFFLHHLQDIEALTVLRIMDRLAKRAMIWNDLIRSRLTIGAIWPLALFSPEVFRHDAIVSIRAGFSKREALDLARRAGWENVKRRTVLWHRFVLTSEK